MLFLLQRHSCPTMGSKFLNFSHWENLPPLSSPKVSSAARCLCCSPLGASSSWYLQVRINENKNFRLLWIKLRYNLHCLEKTYPVIPTKFLPPYSYLGFRVVQSIKEPYLCFTWASYLVARVAPRRWDLRWTWKKVIAHHPWQWGGFKEALCICKYQNAKWGVEETLQMADTPSSALNQWKGQLSSSDMESWSTLFESRPASFPPLHLPAEPEGRWHGLMRPVVP